jgi:NAD(P)-dependent dehydrogenase (short-subunit alcohol dehydrogenase family)
MKAALAAAAAIGADEALTLVVAHGRSREAAARRNLPDGQGLVWQGTPLSRLDLNLTSTSSLRARPEEEEEKDMSVALITGASRGFGFALAKELVGRNWRAVIDGRDAAALSAAASALDGEVVAVPGDVADPAHRRQLVEAVDRFGTLDLLVNNASSLGPSPLPGLERYPIDELEQVYRVNVLAPLALIQMLLPNLKPISGTIVNVTSDAAVEPYEGWGGYGSSKAALDQISAVLGAEQRSIRVYAFDPGDMRTVMHQQAFPGEDISDRPEPETLVPALIRLLDGALPSGRYRASDLMADAQVAS